MDKKTIWGLVLIFLIIVFFQWLNSPSKEEREKYRQEYEMRQAQKQHERDSLAALEQAVIEAQERAIAEMSDSAKMQMLQSKYGLLSEAAEGTEETIELKNDRLTLVFTNRGARIKSAELSEYKAYGDRPLRLFEGDDNTFGFAFIHNNRSYFTGDLYYTLESKNDSMVSYVLNIGDGQLRYSYLLPKESYEARLRIETKNLDGKITNNGAALELEWTIHMPALEKGILYEGKYASSLFYKYSGGDVEELSSQGTQTEEVNMDVTWVAYKDQFFSTVLCAHDDFSGAQLKSVAHDADKDTLIIKDMSASMGVKLDYTQMQSQRDFSFYFLPNDYYLLESFEDKEFSAMLPLGWGIFGWINEYFIIPVFKYLESMISNYGIIILILTFIIKLIIFPFTFSSYKSQAKMRVLKPQMEEINKKIPEDKPLERQQATMQLYKKAGVSPMGGCLPMLLQMPIIFAAFRFFPAAIEFRGQSFLWADDLSTYDSILDLPFSIPFYGSHVGLFCILLCVGQMIYTKSQMQMQSQQMPGMSMMMYLMPVMMLFFLNDYPAALNYYYFISLLVTILINEVIKRFFIDEEAILAQIEANKKKPIKKSRFQERYEQMLKEQQKKMNR
ncbi:MAG: membrane protein insertase YidC [Marinilabiliaceae bacterium]|nr:membrane protein insertase YidC [Marinilabiliaceae bacterium]